MLEITKDALNMKARVMPSTLTALIEVGFPSARVVLILLIVVAR